MEWSIETQFIFGYIMQEAEDFLDADETDYGKACSVKNYLDVVEIGDDSALILGEEPMLTTVFHSSDDKAVIARWFYGVNKDFVEKSLINIRHYIN